MAFGILTQILLFGQEQIICPLVDEEVPFNIRNDSIMVIHFSKNSIPKDEKGLAFVRVLVDGDGKLIKYGVQVIRIGDENSKNSLHFFDLSMPLESITGEKTEGSLENYPHYTRFIVEKIFKAIRKVTFIPKDLAISSKFYQFVIKFRFQE